MPNYYADLLGHYTNGQGGPWDWINKNVITPVKNFVAPPKQKAPSPQQVSRALQRSAPVSRAPVRNNNSPAVNSIRPNFSTPVANQSAQRSSFVAPSFNNQPKREVFIPPTNSTFRPNLADPTFIPMNTDGSRFVPPSPQQVNFRDLLDGLTGNQFRPQSTLRSAIGEGVDALGTGIRSLPWTPFLGASTPRFFQKDTGISEWIKGGDTRFSGSVPRFFTQEAGAEGLFNRERGTQTLDPSSKGLGYEDPGRRMSVMGERQRQEAIRKARERQKTQSQGEFDTSNKAYEDYVNQDSGAFLSNQGVVDDDWIAFWEGKQDEFNQQGFESEEDYYNQLAEMERERNRSLYEALINTYKSQIPGLQEDTDRLVQEQEENVAQLEREGEQRKVEEQNTYGDIIKRMVKNASAARTRTGNIFSGLGTVDSSEFQKRVGEIGRTELEDIGRTERDMAKTLSNINDKILDAKTETGRIIAQIRSDGQKQIQSIMNNINISEAEKQDRLAEININLSEAIMNARRFYEGKKAELLDQARELAFTKQVINAQSEADISRENTITQNALKLNNLVGSAIDPQAEAILQGLSRQPMTPASNHPDIIRLMNEFGMTYDQIIQYLKLYGGLA